MSSVNYDNEAQRIQRVRQMAAGRAAAEAGNEQLRQTVALAWQSVVESALGTMTGAEMTKSGAEPDLVKVGPEGYVHGWKYVGVGQHVPSTGHVIKDDDDRPDDIKHVYHDGKKIGTVQSTAVGKRFIATSMGKSKSVKTMKDALDHIADKAGINEPHAGETSHEKALRLTDEANDDIKSAHGDIKDLALGPKQNSVLNHVHGAPDANPKRSAKSIRAALSSLGQSNPNAAARLKQSLKKANAAGKAWDEHLGFTTHA
jgi:hypothetical protein